MKKNTLYTMVLCLGFVTSASLQSMELRENRARQARINAEKLLFRNILIEDPNRENALTRLSASLNMYQELYQRFPSSELEKKIEALEQLITEIIAGR